MPLDGGRNFRWHGDNRHGVWPPFPGLIYDAKHEKPIENQGQIMKKG
jgi:hypothetical protein